MRLEKAGKILAVCSALILGCGYVAYRYFEQVDAPPERTDQPSLPVVLPSSKNPTRVTVLPSSKSIDAVFSKRTVTPVPDGSTLPPLSIEDPFAKKEERSFLPSSKIGAILRPEDAGVIKREEVDSLLEKQEPAPAEDPPPP